MNYRNRIAAGIAGALVCALGAPALADHPQVFGQAHLTTSLSGYDETPLTLNSAGSGEFTARIHQGGAAIDYTLSYRHLTAVSQAHIHFGRPATTGGIVLFLCTNLTPPAGVPMPQPCPADGGTITGTLSAADIIASANGQGIEVGAAGFAEVIAAFRADAAYVNVHTAAHASGEIRGPLMTRGRFQKDD